MQHTLYFIINFIIYLFQIEPIVQQGHEWLVHHILLYACNFDISPYTPDSAHGFNGHCSMGDQRMRALQQCKTVFYGWAVGGGVSDETLLHDIKY